MLNAHPQHVCCLLNSVLLSLLVLNFSCLDCVTRLLLCAAINKPWDVPSVHTAVASFHKVTIY